MTAVAPRTFAAPKGVPEYTPPDSAGFEHVRDTLLTRDDAAVVLPGHGPTTTIGRERASNPFLQDLDVPARGRWL